MKLVVVGGVAGGASAAARARRIDAKAEIVIYERGGACFVFQLLTSILPRRCCGI